MKIVYNSKIYLDRNNFCQAGFTEALLIKDGRIIKTGTSKEILETAPLNTEKINADGALVLPAFYDSHLHLMWVGRRAYGIECAGAESIEEIINRGKEFIAKHKPAKGTYIRGSGADPDRFTGCGSASVPTGKNRDPRREDLDKITTEHPLIISRHCGHTIYCNSAALSLAGFSESAPDIDGGTAEKDENGRPTGVLRENASVYVQKKMPPLSIQEMKTHIRLAMEKAHAFGITGCGSYDADGPDFDDIVQAYREVFTEYKNVGKPGLRVGMQCGISLSEEILNKHIIRKSNGDLYHDKQWGTFLDIQAIKLFADGTLGGHTAFMSSHYNDNPETRGFPLMEQKTLDHFVQKAAAAGIQVLVHAIGDAGIDMVLNTFEKVTIAGNNPLRHGIIHCQITTPALLKRMARNNIYAYIQPGFLEDDMHILESRAGKKLAETSYAWGSMLKMNIPVRFSTDAPVSSLNPLHCIEWAVNRGGYNPKENVDIYSAVDAYTKPIKEGVLADLVFLDKDIFKIPAEDLQKTKVLKTMCAGEVVF